MPAWVQGSGGGAPRRSHASRRTRSDCRMTSPDEAYQLEGPAGWAVELMEHLGGPGAGLAILVENLFPPVPSEVILPMAGFAARLSELSLLGAIVWTTAGSVLGAWMLYALGAWLGPDRIRQIVSRMPLMELGLHPCRIPAGCELAPRRPLRDHAAVPGARRGGHQCRLLRPVPGEASPDLGDLRSHTHRCAMCRWRAAVHRRWPPTGGSGVGPPSHSCRRTADCGRVRRDRPDLHRPGRRSNRPIGPCAAEALL